MGTILNQLGVKLAYAHARRRRILEGISSMRTLTKEAAPFRVSDILAGRSADNLIPALKAQGAKPLMRIDDEMRAAGRAAGLTPGGAKPPPIPDAAKKKPQDLFAPAKGPSPFSGAAPLAPRTPLPAKPPPVPGQVGSIEHFIMASNPGTTFEDAQKLAPFVASRMSKAASLTQLVFGSTKTANEAGALRPLLAQARIGALLGGGTGAVQGVIEAEPGDTLNNALREAGLGAAAGSIALPAASVIDRAIMRAMKTANVAGRISDLITDHPRAMGALGGATVGGLSGAAAADEGQGLQGALIGAGLGAAGGAAAAPKLFAQGSELGGKLMQRVRPNAASDDVLNAMLVGGPSLAAAGVGAGAAGLGAAGSAAIAGPADKTAATRAEQLLMADPAARKQLWQHLGYSLGSQPPRDLKQLRSLLLDAGSSGQSSLAEQAMNARAGRPEMAAEIAHARRNAPYDVPDLQDNWLNYIRGAQGVGPRGNLP